jgi:hypothetical protein
LEGPWQRQQAVLASVGRQRPRPDLVLQVPKALRAPGGCAFVPVFICCSQPHTNHATMARQCYASYVRPTTCRRMHTQTTTGQTNTQTNRQADKQGTNKVNNISKNASQTVKHQRNARHSSQMASDVHRRNPGLPGNESTTQCHVRRSFDCDVVSDGL